ncbi:histone-binding protein RBBP7 [Trypanosoma conorhini]|uniref:Histone-binding protein RBBP7 n=1 Tax=Trypanosoma conorhini TaxID=83891 RepID=A0A422PFU3_9TRYP|nr:histone-binding protein RBBP7 [Trypanosoma conorhini]RNF16575.1 histone-binding protein RBBP7 [Trypanosoma conorhini]
MSPTRWRQRTHLRRAVPVAGGARPLGTNAAPRAQSVRDNCVVGQALPVADVELKIRAMPQDAEIIAVQTASGFVGVCNLLHCGREEGDDALVPYALLSGHKAGGFALSWNAVKKGYLASGASDGFVICWDMHERLSATAAGKENDTKRDIQPLRRVGTRTDVVTDVSWHGSQGYILLSAGMDGAMQLWDTREKKSGCSWPCAHAGGVTAAQLPPTGAFQVANAGVDGVLRLWDIRQSKRTELLSLRYHTRSITGLQWAPFSETVLSTFSEDGLVVSWDVAERFLPFPDSEDELAPRELVFVHIGHLGRVTDARWSSGSEGQWLMAPTDTMNGLHVYRPLTSVVRDYAFSG